MINQTILIKFMQRRKIKFDVACNGREAVDKWRVGGFHLVLVRLNFFFPIAVLMYIFFSDFDTMHNTSKHANNTVFIVP